MSTSSIPFLTGPGPPLQEVDAKSKLKATAVINRTAPLACAITIGLHQVINCQLWQRLGAPRNAAGDHQGGAKFPQAAKQRPATIPAKDTPARQRKSHIPDTFQGGEPSAPAAFSSVVSTAAMAARLDCTISGKCHHRRGHHPAGQVKTMRRPKT